MDLNQYIFESIHNLSARSVYLDFLAVFLASYLQYALCLGLVILFFYPGSERKMNRPMVILAFTAAIFARLLVKTLIVIFYAVPRPFVGSDTIKSLITLGEIEHYQSFPSGHALFFFAMAVTVYLFNKKIGLWYLLGACLIGIARIYVGVHWPIDVVAGALLGMAVGYLTYFLYCKYL